MIIGILGPGGCGGTFLDWTLQYLSGQDKIWNVNCGTSDRSYIVSQGNYELIDNPLKGKSAHNHVKTHPDENSVDTVIDILQQHTEFDLHSFYFTDSMKSSKTQTQYNQLISKHPTVKFITYNFSQRDIDIIFCFQLEKISVARLAMDRLIMTHSSIPLQQMPIWDQRELMSLYYPGSIKGQILVEEIKPAPNNYSIGFVDIIENLDTEIHNVFDYIGIEICKDRLQKWHKIYNEWKSRNNIDFYNNLDTIVLDIIKNTPHDLSQYNMSFAKEVVIANKLLYNHNLALKSYGKLDLSSNTQQWTEILEPNVYHNLQNIKGNL